MANAWEYIIAICIVAFYIYYQIQKRREEIRKQKCIEALLNQKQD